MGKITPTKTKTPPKHWASLLPKPKIQKQDATCLFVQSIQRHIVHTYSTPPVSLCMERMHLLKRTVSLHTHHPDDHSGHMA